MFDRLFSPTPKFFKRFRAIGLTLTGIGVALTAAPVALPAAIVTIGGYLIVGGAVATAVSQAAVKHDE